MADTASFKIIYDGPSLENNEIAIRELAPALISVADLLEEDNNIVIGGSSTIEVNVKGSFKSGSFGIDFTIIQNAVESIMAFLVSDGITASVNLITLLGLIKGNQVGLIELLKLLRNRPIEEVNKFVDRQVRIKITKSETIEVDERVLDLYKSPRIRQALENVIAKPLEKDGIDQVITSSSDSNLLNNEIHIDKEERSYFDVPTLDDELLGENVAIAYLQVINLSFKEDNKWRFQRGETIFYASIGDAEFQDKVGRNEIQFSKDDILKVNLYTKDYITSSGLRTTYVIEKVLEHRSAARQLRLPMKDDKND